MDSQQKRKVEKGDYGYFEKNKRTQLMISFVLLFFVAVVFYTGYVRYGNTKNIFTIMAVVSVIPMAKFLVSYIVLAPHKGLEKEIYRKVKEIDGFNLAYDLMISSSEKIYEVKITAIRDNAVYLYVPGHNYDKNDVEKYVRGFLEKECKVSAVKMISDIGQYQTEIKKASKHEQGKYDERIRELMLIYPM